MTKMQVGSGGDDPPPPQPKIRITSPKQGDNIDGPSRGEPIRISGDTGGDDAVNIKVKIGDTPDQPAELSADGIHWTFEKAITRPGTLGITAIADFSSGRIVKTTISVSIIDAVAPTFGPMQLTPAPDGQSKIGISEAGSDVTINGNVTEYLGISDLHIEWSYGGANPVIKTIVPPPIPKRQL